MIKCDKWKTRRKWVFALQLMQKNIKNLSLSDNHTAPQLGFLHAGFLPHLERKDLLYYMQQLGMKWHPTLKNWVFTHFLYKNRPKNIYSRTELQNVGLSVKKGTPSLPCWNGMGFLPVYDVALSVPQRRATSKTSLFTAFWRAYDLLRWDNEADAIYVAKTKWGWLFNGYNVKQLISHNGFFLNKVDTVNVGIAQLDRFTSHATAEHVEAMLIKLSAHIYPNHKIFIIDLT